MFTNKLLLAALATVLAACSSGSLPVVPAGPPKRPPPAMVQVENAPQSRPHSGLQKADLVYEYLTEGGITRFTVIYFSPNGSDKIGPVRSARLAALRLQKSYGGVLFYSGASDHVLGLIEDGHVPAVDENTQGGHYFFRDPGHPPPHNLYTSQDRLLEGVEQSSQKVGYPLPAHAEPPKGGDAVTKFSFQQTNAHTVAYTYSADSKTYSYESETGPEVDTENGKQPLQITNVILVRVAHHGAGYTEDVLSARRVSTSTWPARARPSSTAGAPTRRAAGTSPTQPSRSASWMPRERTCFCRPD